MSHRTSVNMSHRVRHQHVEVKCHVMSPLLESRSSYWISFGEDQVFGISARIWFASRSKAHWRFYLCVCVGGGIHVAEMLFSLSEECESHEAPITTPSEMVCACLCFSSQRHSLTQYWYQRVFTKPCSHRWGLMRTLFILDDFLFLVFEYFSYIYFILINLGKKDSSQLSMYFTFDYQQFRGKLQ